MPVPIFLNLPLIVWMGAIQIMLGATNNERIDAEPESEFAHFKTKEKVVRFPKSLVA
jgi:hypothetical protein